MRSKIILLFSLITLISCGGNDDNSNDDGNQNVFTLNVNNVYLVNPEVSQGTECRADGTTLACWRDLIITDGTYTQSLSDNIFYPNNNVTYRINFLELQLLGDFSTPVTLEQNYNADTGNYSNQGTEGIIFYANIVVQNGEIVSSDDLTETEGYVRFSVISENSFNFEIEMLDGTKYNGSYSGEINILDQEYSFAPFL